MKTHSQNKELVRYLVVILMVIAVTTIIKYSTKQEEYNTAIVTYLEIIHKNDSCTIELLDNISAKRNFNDYTEGTLNYQLGENYYRVEWEETIDGLFINRIITLNNRLGGENSVLLDQIVRISNPITR